MVTNIRYSSLIIIKMNNLGNQLRRSEALEGLPAYFYGFEDVQKFLSRMGSIAQKRSMCNFDGVQDHGFHPYITFTQTRSGKIERFVNDGLMAHFNECSSSVILVPLAIAAQLKGHTHRSEHILVLFRKTREAELYVHEAIKDHVLHRYIFNSLANLVDGLGLKMGKSHEARNYTRKLIFMTLRMINPGVECAKIRQLFSSNVRHRSYIRHFRGYYRNTIDKLKERHNRFITMETVIADATPVIDGIGNGKDIIYAQDFLRDIHMKFGLDTMCEFAGKSDEGWPAIMTIDINVKNKPKVLHPSNFASNVANCKDAIILIYLQILRRGDDKGHASLLVLTRSGERRDAEFFDPNGFTDTSKTVSDILQREIATSLSGYRYIGPVDFCPVIGPQLAHFKSSSQVARNFKRGWCVTFTVIYAAHRIINPDFSRDEVALNVKKLVTKYMFVEKFVGYFHKFAKHMKHGGAPWVVKKAR